MLPSRDTSKLQEQHRLKVKGWKMILPANGIREAGVAILVAILISDKIDFTIKK